MAESPADLPRLDPVLTDDPSIPHLSIQIPHHNTLPPQDPPRRRASQPQELEYLYPEHFRSDNATIHDLIMATGNSVPTVFPSKQELDNWVDLRNLDYVSDFDKHLMCPICHCPYIKPTRLQCDHVFCHECLLTAFAATDPAINDQTCPSCRSQTQGITLEVPRLITNMCEDMQVRCPLSNVGCTQIMARGFVQVHFDKLCKYKEVDCGWISCQRKTRRKEWVAGKCLHGLLNCSACNEEVMEQDLDDHLIELCPRLRMTCPDCQTTILRRELESHISTCPEAIFPCPGADYGCLKSLKRTDLEPHKENCPHVAVGPFLKTQRDRIEAVESDLSHLQLRNDVLEGGISSIRNTLNSPRRGPMPSSFDLSDQIGPIQVGPSSSSRHNSPSGPRSPATDDNASLTSPTTHLLSLHESLRNEVAQLSARLDDLDARHSMTMMNDNLRVKEDLAHTNAAVNSLRMQMHYLLSERMLRVQRMGNATATGGVSGPGRTLGMGTSAAAGPSNTGAAGNGSNRPLGGRRLSDGGREGTKL